MRKSFDINKFLLEISFISREEGFEELTVCCQSLEFALDRSILRKIGYEMRLIEKIIGHFELDFQEILDNSCF